MGYLTMDTDYVDKIEREIVALKEQLDISRSEIQGLSRKLVEAETKADYWEREAKKWCDKLFDIRAYAEKLECKDCPHEDTDRCNVCERKEK